ncbi:hypothetical protein K439DRAFT_42491 [Ramaria rubella]|nr:hypothetical protein K439DRAFT_42491 [Ramaria rubella]
MADGCSYSSVSSSLAENALPDLLKRAGVQDRSGAIVDLADWAFSNDLAGIDSGILDQCDAQVKFLHRLKENWRPRYPAKLRFPKDWKPKKKDLDPLHNVTNCIARCELDAWAQQAGNVFSHMSRRETLARHEDPTSCAPDFLLLTACYYEDRVHGEATMESSLRDERGTESAISGAFECMPGCWVGCNPVSRFPESLAGKGSDALVDFAVVLHLLSSKRELGSCPNAHFRLALLRPALLVGIKGPALWPSAHVHTLPCERPINLKEAIKDLAKVVQPSLDTHLLNWQLRSEQLREDTSHLGSQRPVWFMVFGVIYDAEQIVIVAHIPLIDTQDRSIQQPSSIDSSRRPSYISCVVDSIPFPPILLQ